MKFRKKSSALIGVNNKCPECFKTFCDQSTALRHLKHVHAPPFPCDYCQKNIKIGGRPDVLRNHLLRCPSFIKLFAEDAFEQARIQTKLIYSRVKIARDRAFQPQAFEYSDSGYLDLPQSIAYLSNAFQFSEVNDLNFLPEMFPPVPPIPHMSQLSYNNDESYESSK